MFGKVVAVVTMVFDIDQSAHMHLSIKISKQLQ